MSNHFASSIGKASPAEDMSLSFWDHSDMDASVLHGSGHSAGLGEGHFDKEAPLDARPLIEDDYQPRVE